MTQHQFNGRTSGREMAELVREVGIDESRNLSLEEYTILAVEAALGGLTVEQINQLVAASPNFAATNRQTIGELRQIAAGAQASQQSAIEAVGRVIVAPWHPQGALAQAAQNAQTVTLVVMKLLDQNPEVDGYAVRHLSPARTGHEKIQGRRTHGHRPR